LDKVRIKSKKKVLCGHIAVHGALFNLVYGTTSDVQIEGDSGMLLVTPDIFNEYDRVFLGHYHAAQELNDKVEYVGSPLQLSFGEMSQDKHIVVYDFDTDERTYIKNTFSNTHRRFKSTKEAQMTALVENLEGEFIEIYDENTSSVETLELKQLLSTQKLGSLSIKQLPKKIEKEALEIKDAKSILSSTDQMLDSYLKSILNLTLDIEELSKIGKQICETKTEE
jgi:DNA repair exonuclease SbcCD nuclease subunit